MKNKIAFAQILFYTLTFILIGMQSFAQDSSIAKWTHLVKKINEKQIEVTLKGSISKDWHLYKADSNEGLSGILISLQDSSAKLQIPQINVTEKKIKDKVFEGAEKTVYENEIEIIQKLEFIGKQPDALKLIIAYELGKELDFITEEHQEKIVLNDKVIEQSHSRILIPTIDIKHPKNNCGITSTSNNDTKSKSLSSLFLIGFLGGLIALLTPCVFPMIPLTVSFFTKKASSKKSGITNAFLYGFFIFIIYILLSLPFHFLDSVNPEFLNNISTNVYLNVFFFVIFIFFALSFFGFYEITLPASLSSGADSKAGAGNILGIFFMALTLALVSFSCTGPILGSLLAGSLASDGGAMQLTFGMGGFGLALALPFALFALFPNWLQSLPKSGGWLNTVKVVLGFLELALAFKFLSNADMVKHWGLLKREIFIGIWIIIGTGLSLYLFGKIRFSHDSPNQKISLSRKLFASFILLITIYLIPGVTNTSYANLKLISGFPPPLYYSIYQKESDCVLGLHCSKNYDEGLKMAKAENKPLLIDFTGYACVNCRRMEENVWSEPDVYKLMSEKFVVVSLYVDDKKALPVSQQFIYKTKEGANKEINTYGDLWATFETENFANNAQPLYAIIDTNEILLNSPVGYTPDKNEYLRWMNCGLSTFQKK
jgi:thiol:disulfide interchange protein DsbD